MIKYILWILLFPIYLIGQNNQLKIFANNNSDFSISTNNKAIENKVAGILNQNIMLAVNYSMPILKKKKSSNNIFIHKVNNQAEENFSIRTTNKDIYIEANSDIFLEYGAYTFLEKYLGIHYYIPDEKYVPKLKEIKVPKNISIKESPDFKHRQYWFFGSLVPSEEFLRWNKLHNYKSDKEWGMYMVHNMDTFIPDELIKTHPEFFALNNNNERSTDQLDFTNDKLVDFFLNQVRAFIRKNPKQQVIPISPKDNEHYCTCSKCQIIRQTNKSNMATILYLINKVAKTFPDKTFIVQGFKANRQAPTTIKIQPNINFVISDIEVNRLKSINADSSTNTQRFKKDLLDWNNVTNNILIWDYITWHDSSFVPFPTLTAIKDNLMYFNGKARGVFLEGDGGIPAFQYKMKPYIASRLMWNTNANLETLMQEFCGYFYEDASELMLKYYESIDANLSKHLTIDTNRKEDFYKDAREKYLSNNDIKLYRELLNEAKNRVIDKPNILKRIEVEEIGLSIYELEYNKYVNKSKVDNDKVKKLKILLENQKFGTYNSYLVTFENFFKNIE